MEFAFKKLFFWNIWSGKKCLFLFIQIYLGLFVCFGLLLSLIRPPTAKSLS